MTPLQLAFLLVSCAPNVHAETLAAIVAHESGGNPYAIHDNDTSRTYPNGRSFYPTNAEDAIVLGRALVEGQCARVASVSGTRCALRADGDSVDMGLGQINSSNLPGLHREGRIPGNNTDDWVAGVFEPCTNLRSADAILSSAWLTALSYFGPRYAAAHPHAVVLYAISDYNSNSLFRAASYVQAVVAQTDSAYVRQTVRYAYAYASRGTTEFADSVTVAPTPTPQPLPPANAWIKGWLGARVVNGKAVPQPTPVVPTSYYPPRGHRS